MKVIITKPGVTDGSSVLEVGTSVDFPAQVAEGLINGGYATAEKTTKAANDTPKTGKTTAKTTK